MDGGIGGVPRYSPRTPAIAYDVNGNPTRIQETKQAADGSTLTDEDTYGYDPLDRLIKETQRGQPIAYAYDPNGNRTRIQSPAGASDYAYDRRNRPTRIVIDGAETTQTYRADGRLETLTRPNGTQTRTTYDAAGRTASIDHQGPDGPLLRLAYAYDPDANRTAQHETRADGTETTAYRYDRAARLTGYTLTRADGTDETLAYRLDAVGNRLEETRQAQGQTRTRSFAYDAANRLTHSGGAADIAYAYNANGNTLSRLDRTAGQLSTFHYDPQDRLVAAQTGPSAGPATLLGRYDYDHQGRRIRSRDGARGDLDALYDAGAVLEERRPPSADAASGAPYARYGYGDGQALTLVTPEAVQHYHQDALGSTLALTDPQGQLAASYRLDPWGTLREQAGASPNRQIYTGQEHDERTGLIDFGARWYDPAIARFLNQDSYLGDPAEPPSLHRYLYAYGNPTVYVDPDGHCVFAVVDTIACAVVTVQLSPRLHYPSRGIGGCPWKVNTRA